MNDTYKNAVMKWLKSTGYSAYYIAQKTGRSHMTTMRWMRAETAPPYDKLTEVAKRLGYAINFDAQNIPMFTRSEQVMTTEAVKLEMEAKMNAVHRQNNALLRQIKLLEGELSYIHGKEETEREQITALQNETKDLLRELVELQEKYSQLSLNYAELLKEYRENPDK